ncbi:MAG: PQQ-dependent sugar dehydrogenase, partial [Gemmatimonadota bacterium]|nr:PQQ-dependent sugar dehydrogenase [Gemmatimonadota bacterium]
EWEEIDFEAAGGPGGKNYGWSEAEGTGCFRAGCDLTPFEPPLHQYPHSAAPSCSASVTGGYVYRGSALRGLQGHYFYGDFCDNVIQSFRTAGGAATDHRTWTELSHVSGLVSFGEGADGELYVLSLSDGRLYKIVPAEA